MEPSAVNAINGGVNPFSAPGDRNLYSSSSFATNSSLDAEGSLLTGNSPIPGGGVNPFAGGGGSQLQQLIFDRLKLILGENFFQNTDKTLAGGSNPFLNSSNSLASGSINPFPSNGSPIAGAGSLLQQSPFDPLREVLGNNIPFGNSGNTSNAVSRNSITSTGSPPFNKDNAPVGNGNRNFGSNNATIGNFNSDYGSNSATIGNGNWNFNHDNATIGNGNWLFGRDNTTLGTGNWYWDNGSNNATLGNGNWHFRSNNATIGNGNWDFGGNNTIIGNGNWVFTSGNTIIGNGNWLVDSDNTTIGNINNPIILELFPQGIRTGANNLIDSLIGNIGKDFTELTGNFEASSSQTFNRLISSRSDSINDTNHFKDIEQLLASIGKIQGNVIDSQPLQNPQSVPEPTSSVSLIIIGLVCLLLSVFKKQHI
jgi:hypothetical protein